MNWKRMIEFKIEEHGLETWIYTNKGIEKKFDVQVKFGKRLDIVKLKENMLSNFKTEIENIKTSRTDLYSKNKNRKMSHMQ